MGNACWTSAWKGRRPWASARCCSRGNIQFYRHCGFDYARKFGIRYHDLPEGADDSFFLCRELIPGYLNGITGVYQTPRGYYVDDQDVEAFDRQFPPKEKLKLPGQLFD